MNILRRAAPFVTGLVIVAALAVPAAAQQTPFGLNRALGPILNNSAAAAGTVNGPDIQNLSYKGAICTLNMTAEAGNPSTVFSIQMKDTVSNTYQKLVSSGAITALNTPTSIVVYPGIQTSSLPTGMVGISLKLPAWWRVGETITGGTSMTSTTGCDGLN